jgi:hypothetical protein
MARKPKRWKNVTPVRKKHPHKDFYGRTYSHIHAGGNIPHWHRADRKPPSTLDLLPQEGDGEHHPGLPVTLPGLP